MGPRAIALGTFGLLCMVLACSCSNRKQGHGAAADRAAKPAPVKVATATAKDVPVEIRDIATVEAYATVQIKSRVDGVIAQRHFQPGDDVKKDQVLFTIDPKPFEADLRQALASLERNTIQARFAKAAAERSKQLQSMGTVAVEESQDALTKAEMAEASVIGDQAVVENAKLKLSYTTITASIAGRTGDVTLDVGNLVKANADEPMVSIVQMQPIYVTFSVPEQYLQQIRDYSAKGRLRVDAVSPTTEEVIDRGELTFINNEVDKAAGTVLLKATFGNEQRRLWPGQFVNAVLTLTTLPGVTVIPSAAIQTGQQGLYVFVVRPDESAEMRLVTTGQIQGDDIVVESGVKPGEVVVTDGQLRLVQGTKVKVLGDGEPDAPGAKSGGTTATATATATSATARAGTGAGDRP